MNKYDIGGTHSLSPSGGVRRRLRSRYAQGEAHDSDSPTPRPQAQCLAAHVSRNLQAPHARATDLRFRFPTMPRNSCTPRAARRTHDRQDATPRDTIAQYDHGDQRVHEIRQKSTPRRMDMETERHEQSDTSFEREGPESPNISCAAPEGPSGTLLRAEDGGASCSLAEPRSGSLLLEASSQS